MALPQPLRCYSNWLTYGAYALVFACAACGGSGGGQQAKASLSSSAVVSASSFSAVNTSSSSQASINQTSTSQAAASQSSMAWAQLRGVITLAEGMLVDSDTNDINAPYADNSTPDTAQPLPSQAQVHGFVSATASGGDPVRERFAEQADRDDFFRVVLNAGQRIQLQPFAEGDNTGDADLYVFDSELQLIAASDGDNSHETLVVGEAGEYVINVHAAAGASRYVLRLLAAEEGATGDSLASFVAGEMVVKYRASGAAVSARSRLQAFPDARPQREMLALNQLADAVPALAQIRAKNRHSYERTATLRHIKQARHLPEVEFAEPNYLRRPQLLPDDAGFVYQWNLERIHLPAAWDITTGEAAEPIIVAVLDTGILPNHPDLQGRLVAGYDFISDATRARDGDGIDADPTDAGDSAVRGASSWHGTHVAGIIAAASNNRIGMTGVSWGANIMPMRVLGVDGGTSYDISQGLRYAAGLSNDSGTYPARAAHIINLSFGGPEVSQVERETYTQVRAQGVFLVAAAGNTGREAAFYPASYPGVIGVSATDYRNNLAYYATYGNHVSLAAPGGDLTEEFNPMGVRDGIYSASGDDSRGDSVQPIYRLRQGSSAAAPHVSGVIALMLAIYPALTPDEFYQHLRAGKLTDELGGAAWTKYFGYGHINAHKAVLLAKELAGGTLPVPDVPANVQLSHEQLALGFGASDVVEIHNVGGGAPVLLSASASENWLTLDALAAQQTQSAEPSLVARYRISAQRDGLAAGVHRAHVRWHYAPGGELLLPVSVLVEQAAPLSEPGQIYVSLIDAESRQRYASQVAYNSAGQLAFYFAQLRAGRYWLVAGSDTDANGFLCEPGESCASLGGATTPELLTLESGDDKQVSLPLQLLEQVPDLPPVTY